jgi:hypothetical protein
MVRRLVTRPRPRCTPAPTWRGFKFSRGRSARSMSKSRRKAARHTAGSRASARQPDDAPDSLATSVAGRNDATRRCTSCGSRSNAPAPPPGPLTPTRGWIARLGEAMTSGEFRCAPRTELWANSRPSPLRDAGTTPKNPQWPWNQCWCLAGRVDPAVRAGCHKVPRGQSGCSGGRGRNGATTSRRRLTWAVMAVADGLCGGYGPCGPSVQPGREKSAISRIRKARDSSPHVRGQLCRKQPTNLVAGSVLRRGVPAPPSARCRARHRSHRARTRSRVQEVGRGATGA